MKYAEEKKEEIKKPETKNPEIEKIKKDLRKKGRKRTYSPVYGRIEV